MSTHPQEGPQQPASCVGPDGEPRTPYPRKKSTRRAAKAPPVDDGKVGGTYMDVPPLTDPAWRDVQNLDRSLAWPGLYVMMDEAGKVVYVGQSSRCLDRLSTHQREGKKKWARAVVLCESHWPTRLRLEALLILKYLPKYNRALCLGIDKAGECYELGFVLAKTRKGV